MTTRRTWTDPAAVASARAASRPAGSLAGVRRAAVVALSTGGPRDGTGAAPGGRAGRASWRAGLRPGPVRAEWLGTTRPGRPARRLRGLSRFGYVAGALTRPRVGRERVVPARLGRCATFVTTVRVGRAASLVAAFGLGRRAPFGAGVRLGCARARLGCPSRRLGYGPRLRPTRPGFRCLDTAGVGSAVVRARCATRVDAAAGIRRAARLGAAAVRAWWAAGVGAGAGIR
ncbi:hypothetical protein F4558_006001 [Micromonospora profundi]|nr:hypothetical protein [Micromonospora profundi]